MNAIVVKTENGKLQNEFGNLRTDMRVMNVKIEGRLRVLEERTSIIEQRLNTIQDRNVLMEKRKLLFGSYGCR